MFSSRGSARSACLAAALLLLLSLPSAPGATVHVDDFEGGVNPSGWAFIRGGDVFEGSGGNPGGWLHQPSYDTFAPTLDCVFGAATPFRGNYVETGVTRISLDAQTLDVDFGDGDGFSLTLVLRNSHGTPSNFDDDDLVYFVGPNVPRVGEGWVHYDFEVPSDFDGTLPPGWKGGWAGDCENLRPGVTWADVVSNVERVEFWWIDPCFFAIFQNWNVGADNIAIEFGDPAGAGEGPDVAGGWVHGLELAPNPARDGTTLRFDLREASPVTVDVMSATGRLVRSLSATSTVAGRVEIHWDGRDGEGRSAAAGRYYLLLRGTSGAVSRSLVVLR